MAFEMLEGLSAFIAIIKGFACSGTELALQNSIYRVAKRAG